jgi:hypothetical protein
VGDGCCIEWNSDGTCCLDMYQQCCGEGGYYGGGYDGGYYGGGYYGGGYYGGGRGRWGGVSDVIHYIL